MYMHGLILEIPCNLKIFTSHPLLGHASGVHHRGMGVADDVGEMVHVPKRHIHGQRKWGASNQQGKLVIATAPLDGQLTTPPKALY